MLRWYDTKSKRMIYPNQVNNLNFRDGSDTVFRLWLNEDETETERDRYVLIDYSVEEMKKTQFVDSKGKAIYEGDIVHYPKGVVSIEERRGFVEWDRNHYVARNEFAGYYLDFPSKQIDLYLFVEDCEVIGNIHENFELLNQI